MSDESDAGSGVKRKRTNRVLDTSISSSSSGSPIIGSSSRRRRIDIRHEIADDSDSDDGTFVEVNRRKRVSRLFSDSSSESSGSEIIRNFKKKGRIMSDTESDGNAYDGGFEGSSSSQWESDFFSDNEVDKTESTNAATKVHDTGVDSDSSDGQSEKCPICLLSFKTQEIGSPESCDHIFCVECIQEWSKNMNTCPVDRQKYSLILVRKSVSGKIIRQIPVQTPTPQNEIEIIEDPTFCEICGSADREERMLLCDGCDLGFHLECLTPPLDDIPVGSWFCPDCMPDDTLHEQISLYDIQLFLDDSTRARRSGGRRRTSSPSRLIPRTRHTERVRNRIRNIRINNVSQSDDDAEEQPSTSGQNDTLQMVQNNVSPTSRRRPKKKKSRKKKKRSKYRFVYQIDDATGETVVMKKRKTRRRRHRERPQVQPKSVKKRLALHLGICAPRSVSQALPDVKIQINAGGINHQRYQAGIPTLNLFGNRETLDYFSPSDDEIEYNTGPSGYLVRRAPNRSDVSILQRVARTKSIMVSPSVSSSTDVLDSILDCQSKFHSKNTVFSLDGDGKFKMSTKDSNSKGSNSTKPNLQEYSKLVRKAPGYSHNETNSGVPSSNPGSNMYQYNTGYSYNYMQRPSYQPQANMGGYSRMNENYDVPQDYSQRTLSASYLYPPPEENRRNKDNKNENDESPRSNTPNTESEVDIYSDIENDTVSTSRLEDFYLKPPPTPPILRTPPNLPTDEENDRDSEADMVIDTEKVDPEKYDPAACDYEDDLPEEGQVTSTVDTTTDEAHTETINSSYELTVAASEIQSQAVQSSDQIFDQSDDLGKEGRDQDDDDLDSEDGCPNFSIYSKESINLAKTTDLTMMQASCVTENNQVEEISSTPTTANIPSISQNDWSDEDIATAEDTENLRDSYSNPEYTSHKLKDATTTNVDDPNDTWEDIGKEESPEKKTANDSWEEVEKEADSKKDANDSWEEVEKEENQKKNANDSWEELEKEENQKKNANDSWEDIEKKDLEKDDLEKNSVNDTAVSDWEDEEKDAINNDSVIKGSKKKSVKSSSGLYSDSEDETVVKKDNSKFIISDIQNMTEDISEEERSYTPCLDEHRIRYREGLEGLDTEMISDEDRNDFDESHELKTGSDGDALEINAKESELDFTRPEDYEEGEIIDKSKSKKSNDVSELEDKVSEEVAQNNEENPQNRAQELEKDGNKENEARSKDASFKKLSKNNKERNYRGDREKENKRSRSRDKSRSDKRDKKREKRREIERYDVRALIAEKPRRLKDKFGRDIRETPSPSRSKSVTPPPLIQHKSPSRGRQSPPRRRRRSRDRRSLSHSRSRSEGHKRSRSKNKKRRRSVSKGREKRRKSRDRNKKSKKPRSHSRHQSASPERRRRPRSKRHSHPREWAASLSPSWTPPHVAEPMQPHNFTVILPNDTNKKKKDKRKRSDKRSADRQRKRKRSDRTPPPSKEVFASGDNILVSVSFNKENETRDVSTNKKKREEELARRKREKRRRLAKKNLDISAIKPVAVIDLERSPFREITSPKDVIVLTDSENDANDINNIETGLCDSSQQVASPERCITTYTTGPKTPPEPQIKFSLNSKQVPLRVISNPLGDADDLENEIDAHEELDEGLDDIYKGPNTPPEPPNSPPSSPDAYDPFEPTKSRSPTPEPLAINPPNEAAIPLEEGREESILIESIRTGISEIMGKGTAPLVNVTLKSTDARKSHTPPIADIQPADSQTSLQPATPDSNIGKSPDLSHSLNQTARLPSPSFSSVNSKPVAQTIPFSTISTSMITSTPVSTTMAPPRITILNNTVITPSANSSVPQRIVLPNAVKSSPVKISPTKPTIKSTPIKPMPAKNVTGKPPRKLNVTNQISNEVSDMLDFDSPYSPGSSDYEDLFEPPPESSAKSKTKIASKSPGKIQNIFDVLFGTTQNLKSNNKTNKNEKPKYKKIAVTPTKGTKLVGVKLDEDSLKILDDLPSSAVEMQVKDKFLKKLNRQERVVEEVKLVLKPYYNKKRITKEEYKDIMRRAVPKICHNKTGEINPTKIKNLVEAYVKKIRHNKKVTSSSSINPQKV